MFEISLCSRKNLSEQPIDNSNTVGFKMFFEFNERLNSRKELLGKHKCVKTSFLKQNVYN